MHNCGWFVQSMKQKLQLLDQFCSHCYLYKITSTYIKRISSMCLMAGLSRLTYPVMHNYKLGYAED